MKLNHRRKLFFLYINRFIKFLILDYSTIINSDSSIKIILELKKIGHFLNIVAYCQLSLCLNSKKISDPCENIKSSKLRMHAKIMLV